LTFNLFGAAVNLQAGQSHFLHFASPYHHLHHYSSTIMAQEGQRQWGLSPPISLSPPTQKDLALNQSLLDHLQSENNFEPTEDTQKRGKTLELLQKVVEEFVRHIGKSKGLAPSVIEAAGGKVSTFGSYRLGVYGPGRPIQTIKIHPGLANSNKRF
jgi:poly(A) polymerase